jgi:uncharacterized Zn finger protein (UPF0148 family)
MTTWLQFVNFSTPSISSPSSTSSSLQLIATQEKENKEDVIQSPKPKKRRICAKKKTVAITRSETSNENERSDYEKKVKEKLLEFHEFVKNLAKSYQLMDTHIQTLEQKKASLPLTREMILERKRIDLLQQHLRLHQRAILKKVDSELLDELLKQMQGFMNSIPVSEHTEQTLWECYLVLFESVSVTPKTIAKDYCSKCKQPLFLLRKQALLQCTICARLTIHLMSLSSSNRGNYMKNSFASNSNSHSSSQNENNKRSNKLVLGRLNQFRVQNTVIHAQVLEKIRKLWRLGSHTESEQVTAKELTIICDKYEDLKMYGSRVYYIASVLNGYDPHDFTLTDDEIMEIMSRLNCVLRAFSMEQRNADRETAHFFTTFFVHQICLMKGYDVVAQAFPPQRTTKISQDQYGMWRTILKYLQENDTLHQW